MCYNLNMAKGRPYGVAVRFWKRIKQRTGELGLTQTQVVAASGIAASTINNLKYATRPPLARVVLALADAVQLDRGEALVLAGVVSGEPDGTADDVRAAIANSASYGEQQKEMLLQMVDLFDQANGASPRQMPTRADPQRRPA